MTTDLREELAALAETQPFSPDPSAWDRGRRARRRARVVRAGAGLAVVALVVGVGAIAVRPDAVAPAGDVRGGALPSRVPEPDGPVLTYLAIGAASVAYVDTNAMPVLVDAMTGEAHHVSLPDFPDPAVFERTAELRRGAWLALSPDGRRLAYPTTSVFEREPGEYSFTTSWYRVVDLTTGESDLVDIPPYGSTPIDMSWTADGRIAVVAFDKGRINKPVPDLIRWVIDPATGDASTAPLAGVVAPGGGISALLPEDDDLVDAVRFETATGTDPASLLPPDRYPEGAVVQPIGWVEHDVLVASLDPPQSDVVERPRLVLITSPERPESASSFREFLPRLPPSLSLGIAVDLVPDLTGDPDQELTHDFTAAQPAGDSEGGRTPIVLGGLMALLGGIAFIRMMQQRA
jgi:hypothetical protein